MTTRGNYQGGSDYHDTRGSANVEDDMMSWSATDHQVVTTYNYVTYIYGRLYAAICCILA